MSYVDGFVIRNNTIYNGENIGIDAAGGYSGNPDPELNYARNGIIVGNHVYKLEHASGPLGGYGAIGIYVDGARNITVERNRVGCWSSFSAACAPWSPASAIPASRALRLEARASSDMANAPLSSVNSAISRKSMDQGENRTPWHFT